MSYKNGTYVAFDAQGEADPTKSDFRYYSTILGWAKHRNIQFHFINSHEKTYAVRNTSSQDTLRARIRERLALSKNMIIILSSQTRKSGSELSYEIEQAIDHYRLPLIITYSNYDVVADPKVLSYFWPYSLQDRIDSNMARAIHIGFKKEALLDAINRFTSTNIGNLNSLSTYSQEDYVAFGVPLSGIFCNRKKNPPGTYWPGI